MNIKRNVLITLLFALPFITFSQKWKGLNGGANYFVQTIFGDTINDILYATGPFTQIGGIPAKSIVRWNGTVWDSIGRGTYNSNPGNSFTMYKGQLIALSGFFKPNKNHIAQLNGSTWDSIGSNFSGDAFAGIITLNNELYVYGTFDTINNIHYGGIAKWDGLNWLPLPVIFPYNLISNSAVIHSLAIYNNDLYVGGSFFDSTGTLVSIAKFNGSYWSIPGAGFIGNMDQVFDLAVYQNELYAAGEFKIADGNAENYIARWNGAIWHDVGGGVTSSGNGQIYDLLLLNNKLYAGGVFTEIGGISAVHIAAWDGTDWCGFGNTDNASVTRLATVNNDLFLTCNISFDGVTVNGIAQWIGGNYVSACGNTTGIAESKINNEKIKIYPNPTTSQLTIEFTATSQFTLIEIKNVLGQVVKNIGNKETSGKQLIEIDMSGLPSGVYFVKLQNDKQDAFSKFIKN